MSLALWLHPANLVDCGRAVVARASRAWFGPLSLPGDAGAVIEAGIDRTWNGRSFTASLRWFHTFWLRDLAFSSVALERLGGRHRERLVASLAWALAGWERHGSHITTTFHPGGCWRGRGGLILGEESMLCGAIFLDYLRSPMAAPARLA
jgi:hypothetical protein